MLLSTTEGSSSNVLGTTSGSGDSSGTVTGHKCIRTGTKVDGKHVTFIGIACRVDERNIGMNNGFNDLLRDNELELKAVLFNECPQDRNPSANIPRRFLYEAQPSIPSYCCCD